MSRLWIVDFKIRLAGAELRCGGLAGVFTPPQHRRRGHARALLNGTLDLMREQGYALTALYGVPDLYHRFDYATVAPEFLITIETRVAERESGELRVRLARKRDLPAIVDIYNATNSGLTGSTVRNRRTWPGPIMGSAFDRKLTRLLLAVDSRDRPLGYLLYDREPADFTVGDAGLIDPAAAPALLAKAAAVAVRRRVERLRFKLHPEVGFGAYLRRLDVRVETERPLGRGPMARLLDQPAVLRAIAPTLRQRVVAGGSEPPGRLRIKTELGEDAVELPGSARDVVLRLPQARLTQLLYGHWSVSELAEQPEVKLPRRAIALLERLFPRQDAYCYSPDRY